MKTFNKIFAMMVVILFIIVIAANLFLSKLSPDESDRLYRVEIERLTLVIAEKGLDAVDLSDCEYVVNIEKEKKGFYETNSDYVIREINGELYRFDYTQQNRSGKKQIRFIVNIVLGVMSAVVIFVMLFVRSQILSPFERLKDVPYELSKGNLTAPLKESKSRFFGKFVWGVELLRVQIEEQRQRELLLQREKKRLLLSLSHDIKTPLLAIKLYAKALTKNLYPDKKKQDEIAECINGKADEIEKYVSQIVVASKEDFLSLEVDNTGFYMADLMAEITEYYRERLALNKTEFHVAQYENCLLGGDLDRSVEVMQNILENALKYGDGKRIEISFAEEENAKLISIRNSGCSLADTEIPHIFESFWRGANARQVQGAGLGLYICRQLMHKMNGEIFAEVRDGEMVVTVVFGMEG